MKPNYHREKYYREECEHSLYMFTKFIHELFDELLVTPQDIFSTSIKWHENINYLNRRRLVDKFCDVEMMCVNILPK